MLIWLLDSHFVNLLSSQYFWLINASDKIVTILNSSAVFEVFLNANACSDTLFSILDWHIRTFPVLDTIFESDGHFWCKVQLLSRHGFSKELWPHFDCEIQSSALFCLTLWGFLKKLVPWAWRTYCLLFALRFFIIWQISEDESMHAIFYK